MIHRFAFRQTLVGSHRFVRDATLEHPLSVTLEAEHPRLLPPMSGRLSVVGEIDAEGLAERRPLRGTVDSPRWQLGMTRYELEFESNDGRPLRLRASRKPSLREPIGSLSRVVGSVIGPNGGTESEVELRLDYRQAVGRLLR